METSFKTKAGALFRQIRLQRGFSVSQLADQVISVSQVNKFEAGKTQLSFWTLATLLNKMAFSLDDFYEQLETKSLASFYRAFLTQLDPIYQANDLPTLKVMSQNLIKAYQREPSLPALIQAATVISFTKSIQDNYLVDPVIASQLAAYLLQVTYWGKLETAIFNNCSFLLTNATIKSIVKELIYAQKDPVTVLANMVDVLYQKQDYDLAYAVLEQANKLTVTPADLYTRFKLNFMTHLLTLPEAAARVQNQHLIEGALRALGTYSLASTFEVYMDAHPFPKMLPSD